MFKGLPKQLSVYKKTCTSRTSVCIHMNFKGLLHGGGERASKLKKNIFASILIKGVDVVIGLLLVPLTLGYLNVYEYGIWMTLYTLLSWINSFDIGLSNGLRNKLAEAVALGNKEKARSYVSTTVIILSVIAVILVFVFSIASEWLNWYTILNVEEKNVSNLSKIVYLSFCLFCFNFVFKFIGSIYQALQLPAVNSGIAFAGHLLSLLTIWLCTKLLPGNLMIVALIYSAFPPLVYLCCYPITFFKLFPYLSPSIRYFRRENVRELLSLSVLFFLIQIAGIVLFSLTNLIISHQFGPDKVTPYDIAYKYYQIPVMLFNLLIVPVWSAVTDAYTKGELDWIMAVNKKLKMMLVLIAALMLFMTIVSQAVFRIWIGDAVQIPYSLCLLMAIYTFLILYSISYSYLLNGMNKVSLQAVNTVIVAILFYPICLFFSRRWGVEGVLIGMCACNISGAVLNALQFYKVVRGKDVGIWSR